MTIDELAWGDGGLLPVVIQDAGSGAVLTLAYANREALARTLADRTTWLYSRSRAALWNKGETSGNTQAVTAVSYDCDADALLYRVLPAGPACHTGAASCFSNDLLAPQPMKTPAESAAPEPTAAAAPPEAPAAAVTPDETFARAIAHLQTTIAARRNASPESSYTAKLLNDGVDRIAKKIGEEATEVVIAAKNGAPAEIAWEVADLVYHTLVLLEERRVPLAAVGAELLRRAR